MLEVKLTRAILTLVFVTLRAGSTDAMLESNIPDISQMNFMERCKELKQNCEEYNVTTKDGYILTVHRIVGNTQKPLLLWHGLFDSSETFILRGQNSSGVVLGQDHDVWLGNSRGNRYSRHHVILDPDKDKNAFWNFTFHEMALYDMSATIDFVLNKTGQDKLSGIGHSQGNLLFYILTSMRPAYNQKVRLFIALAPIAFVSNMKPVGSYVLQLWPAIKAILDLSGNYELLSDQTAINKVIKSYCNESLAANVICTHGLILPFLGDDLEELDLPFYKVLIQRYLAGSSTKDISHFEQMHRRKRFARFDHGTVGNLIQYGSASPPDYDLKKVTTTVALLCGANDRLATLEDVQRLKELLPNVVYKVMDRKQFNHLDFVWGKNINVYLNPLLKELLNKYG